MKATDEASRTPTLVTFAFGGVAVVLYLFCIAPCGDALDRSRRQLGDQQFQLDGVYRDLRGSNNVKGRLTELKERFRPYGEGMLTPLLGSWAMRAKSILDPLAERVGLTGVDYQELPPRALPLTKPVAKQLYARRPVRMTCSGSYAALVSFILCVERDFPLVTLQSLRISARNEADRQVADLVFEWPADGGSSIPPKTSAKGRTK